MTTLTLSATVALAHRWASLGKPGLVKKPRADRQSPISPKGEIPIREVKPARPAKRIKPTTPTKATALLPGLANLPELHPGLTADEVEAIHRQETDVILAELRLRFPLAFTNPPTPFAIGFRHRIRRATKASIPAGKLWRAVDWWIAQAGYQRALAAGMQRRRLDGSPAQFPTVDQIALARQRLGLMPRPILLPAAARAHLRAAQSAGSADAVRTKRPAQPSGTICPASTRCKSNALAE